MATISSIGYDVPVAARTCPSSGAENRVPRGPVPLEGLPVVGADKAYGCLARHPCRSPQVTAGRLDILAIWANGERWWQCRTVTVLTKRQVVARILRNGVSSAKANRIIARAASAMSPRPQYSRASTKPISARACSVLHPTKSHAQTKSCSPV